MPRIVLHTEINALPHVVFDFARSVDIHQVSTSKTKETVVAGRSSGLMELGETVTWRAKHFGVYQTLTSKITHMQKPSYFVDEMEKGAFKHFKHEHFFKERESGVRMIDVFEYTSPFGLLGDLADFLFLKNYMTRFLEDRNKVIKELAEKTNPHFQLL